MSFKFSNILVVRTDRIGDVILTTPALAALRKNFPSAKISIMVTPLTAEIVQRNPNIDEVIVYDKNEKNKGILGFWKFVMDLRQKKFDLAVVFHTKKRTNLICFLSGIPKSLGYRDNKFGFLLTDGVKDTRPEGTRHEAQYCLDLLENIGIEVKEYSNLFMPVLPKFEAWAKQFLISNGITIRDSFIVIHPGGSDDTKRWPAKKFAELIDLIGEKYNAKIILVGGLETQEIVETIKQLTKKELIDAVGLTTVGQLGALIKDSKLLISNDSGPVHIASAVGTPVISIFGRRKRGISVIRWRPLGPKDMAIYKEEPCDFCRNHDVESCPECLKSIEAEVILKAMESTISLPPK